MKNKDFFDDLSARLCKALPDGVIKIKEDVEKNFRAILLGTFAKLDIVTREEFDAQKKVLARTRKKLETLEKQLADLEAKLHEKR